MKSKVMKKGVLVLFLGLAIVLSPKVGNIDIAKAESQIKPIELTLNTMLPARSWAAVKEWGPWAKKIEELCGGRVKITIYWGDTLTSASDAYDSAVKGIADMAWGTHAYSPGRFPMSSVFTLPGLAQSMVAGQHIIYDLYQKFPQIEAEHKGVKVLWLAGLREYSVFTADKPVRRLEDFKGLRLRASGDTAAPTKVWGAAPISMPITECYTALQRNVIDGTIADWTVVVAFKIDEVTKYATFAPLSANTLFLVMNEKKWNSLPKDIQEIFEREGKRHWLEFPVHSDEFAFGVIKKFKGMPGHEVIALPPKEREKWIKTAAPVYSDWVANMEAKGLPGKELLDEARRLAKKYNAEYPAPWLAL
jgi:TRAP-type C4-dicarboxylate transport system substrate-binding protein